jgi:hypothetical protein
MHTHIEREREREREAGRYAVGVKCDVGEDKTITK